MGRRFYVSLAFGWLGFVGSVGVLAQANGKLQLHFLDVGQGDAAALVSPQGETVLIDNGPSTDCGKPLSFLQSLGLTKIDYHIASHYHADHIGCTTEVLGQFPLAKAAYDRGGSYSTQTYSKYAAAVAGKRVTVVPGTRLTLDPESDQPVYIDFITANGDGISTTDENALSVVAVVRFGAFDAVFGGDLSGSSPDIESSVASKVGQVEVYKVHHHGSRTSTTIDWLTAVRPQVAVLSVGISNSYGHPTQDALDRLHGVGTQSYWTSDGNGASPIPGFDHVAGDVTVEVEPGSSSFTVQRPQGKDTYSFWEATATCTSTAQCKDGSWSCSTTASGTCSSHGGVACWVCPGVLCHGSDKPCTSVPPTCSYSASPSSHSVGVTATSRSVTVTTTSGCEWTANSNAAWITVTSGGTGSGSGTVTFSVGANSGTSARTGSLTVAGQTVTVTQDGDPAQQPPFGAFDTPTGAATLQGSFAVTGWTLDDTGVERVEIWRDPVASETTPPYYGPGQPGHGKIFIANPLFVTGSRPDVQAAYPNYPQSNRAGWGYLLLSWGLWNQGNGTYKLYAYAYDTQGNSALLGTKTITVDNAHATKPFGAIDTPSYGGTVSGALWNFGWVLTPNATPTCTITNGNVHMNIDSGPFFSVNYGDLRTDIAASFPGFSNGNNSGGAYYFDSTTLTNGVHTIGWLVYDSCGRGDGVGSRFFTVLNGSGDEREARPSRRSTERLAAQSVESAGRPAEPNRNPVGVRQLGEDWQWVWPDEKGWRVIEVGQLGRIEVQLPQSVGGRYVGYQVVNDERLELPIGSSLDATAGIFYWQPAPGFFGSFDLVFEAPGTNSVRVKIMVK